jgi:hypothetical protein
MGMTLTPLPGLKWKLAICPIAGAMDYSLTLLRSLRFLRRNKTGFPPPRE